MEENDVPRFGRSARRVVLASACSIAIVSATAVQVPAAVARSSQPARHAASRTPLCSSAESVTRLVVRRTDALPQNHFRFSFPASVVVTEAASVRNVSRALCALPAMPNQMMSCPADFGITYNLEFSRAKEQFRVVMLDASGCQTVHGLAQLRWIARNPRFWRVLGTAMRLKSPSWATFRGTA